MVMSVFKKKFYTLKLKVLVSFLLVILIALPPLVNIFVPQAQAGSFTSAKLTISDSRAGQSSVDHTFVFTPIQTTSIKTIDFIFCTTASGTCTTPTGLVTTTGVQGTPTGISGTGYASTFTTNGTITLTVTTPATQALSAITVPYTVITNPTTINTTYYVRITTRDASAAAIDTSTVAYAVLTTTSLAITASVDPTFTFTVAGVASGGTVNSATTNITTAAATIPFGTLVSGTANIGAHDVSVTTNSLNGYVVTVKAAATPPLADGSNNIDPFTGTYASPATWSAPAGTAASVNTGFFGYTTEDTDFSVFQSNKWAGSETTARAIVSNATGTSTQTTRIGWRAEVNSVQPSGSYTGTAILVATPTY